MPDPVSNRKSASSAAIRAARVAAAQNVKQKHSSWYQEAATVHDRIRAWQTQGTQEAGDPDVLSVRSQPRSVGAHTPVRAQTPEADAQSTPRRKNTEWVQTENQAWVKQRRRASGQGGNREEPQVQRSTSRHESPRTEYKRTESQRVRDATSSRAEREERRKRRREVRARTNGGAALVDDGIRVYNKSRSNLGSEKDFESTPARSERAGSDREDYRLPEYESQVSFKHDGPLPDGGDDVDKVQAQPSKYAATLGQNAAEELEQPKTKKRAILNRLTGKDTPQTASNRLPSIEAWLDEQPELTDPFTDGGSVIVVEPSHAPTPLKHKQRKRMSLEPTIAEEVQDPNKIWENITPPKPQPRGEKKHSKRNEKRRESETSTPRRRLFSFEVCEEQLSKGEDPAVQPSPQIASVSPTAQQEKRRRRRQEKAAAPLEDLTPQRLNRADSIQPERDISKDKEGRDLVTERRSSLKRKLTTHEDLMSVLSQPRAQKSTRSVRSVQGKAALDPTVIAEALSAMRAEETKYTRELRTLVDGVTPVLLQSLLSKKDAGATAGLFSDSGNDASLTRPIIDMGVALQRLKNMHNRIPLQEQQVEALLTWAITAHKSYSDYVRSWRLGFQGIIVSLAPLDPSQMPEQDMLAPDIDGDATNEQGEKVDVAYLQKRPLVRIKRFSKLLATIKDALPPGHEKAAKAAGMYLDLTEAAKQRHSEEQGRLEDEAAANIDTSKSRDIKTMAPLDSVEIDKTRKVRARDFFDLSMCHSTGQRLDCKVEIILRDDPQASGTGDILICQVEEDTKWLLFQPVLLSNVSTRRDQSETDLVLMIRGVAGIAQTWTEMPALKAEDLAAATEWLHMLGSNPLPPKLNHLPSWHLLPEPQPEPEPLRPALNAAALANLPSDVDVPIGEPSLISSRKPKSRQPDYVVPSRPPGLNMGGGLQQKRLPEHYQYAPSLPPDQHSPKHSTVSSNKQLPARPKDSRPSSIATPSVISSGVPVDSQVPQQRYSPQKVFSQPSTLSDLTSNDTMWSRSENSQAAKPSAKTKRPQYVERSQEPPLMSGALSSQATPEPHKVRQVSSEVIDGKDDRSRKHERTKSSIPLTDTIRDQWAALAGFRKKTQTAPSTPVKTLPTPELVTDDLPMPQPTIRKDSPSSRSISNPTDSLAGAPIETPLAPPLPSHRYGSQAVQRSLHLEPRHDGLSPLKHEYQTSSSSGDESDSDETDATSDISEDDFRSELKDQPTPLVQVGQGGRRTSFGPGRPLPSVPSSGTTTLDPSDSASNSPYRRAPPPSAFPASKKRKTAAMVCSWSVRGIWEPIREDECSIVISPGLVQAFPMSAAHSQPLAGADWEDAESEMPDGPPLVEFELTPIVPLRKGTALDITIRSPPTPNSTILTTNNVMFRSRTVQDCERLYQYINWARCNNPTYATLAKARAREHPVTFAVNVEQKPTRSWFSFGSREKSSYRASSRPPTSVADSGMSGASSSSFQSALRRFTANSPFSLNRSSVLRRPGTVPASLYSSSNGGSGSGSSTPAPSQAGFVPGPDGPNVPATSAEAANGGGMVNNMKVRLFVRQGQKWEALGQALLTVLPAALPKEVISRPGSPDTSASPRPSRPPSSMPGQPRQPFRLPSSGHTPHRIHGDGREKRILITSSKRKEVVLLDEVLGESCFEKVMQTGIAVNVWKEDSAVQEYGGVMMGRSRTYMIQFRTSTEASWVFNMCGTYRYGITAGT